MLVHVLIRCLPQRVGRLLSQRRSLHVELPSSYRNRSESFVLSWGSRVPPERLPRRAVRGLGAHSAEADLLAMGFNPINPARIDEEQGFRLWIEMFNTGGIDALTTKGRAGRGRRVKLERLRDLLVP